MKRTGNKPLLFFSDLLPGIRKTLPDLTEERPRIKEEPRDSCVRDQHGGNWIKNRKKSVTNPDFDHDEEKSAQEYPEDFFSRGQDFHAAMVCRVIFSGSPFTVDSEIILTIRSLFIKIIQEK
jgi:hypothetical protein